MRSGDSPGIAGIGRLAKASEQFKQSDVALWGAVALVCGAVAVFGANISALVPQSALSGLHKTHLEGASFEQLRVQVAELRAETTQLKRENELLVGRFSLQEHSGNEVTRRIGALEISVPRLLEALPTHSSVDRSNVTASIGTTAPQSFEAEGGTVTVRQTPLAQGASQPLPDPVQGDVTSAAANAEAYGIAIGVGVEPEQTASQWGDLTTKLGPLLFGLTPVLVDQDDGDRKRIVVGPIHALSEATALCQRLERISISCVPMPYAGEPLKL